MSENKQTIINFDELFGTENVLGSFYSIEIESYFNEEDFLIMASASSAALK